MTRILVTGGCGFIGSHLTEYLAGTGQDVTVLDAADPAFGAVPSVRYLRGDVRDENAVAEAAARAEVIYHMSAVVGVDRYLTAPADVVEINLLGTRSVLRAARATGAKVIVASTSEVYGKNPAAPWDEDADRVVGSTAADRWSYSTSKALAEHLTFGYIRQYQVRATILRYFNVYGPRQRPAYVVSRSVHRVLNGLTPEVYDSGRQTRCFTYIDDAIRGTVLAAAAPAAEGEHFNIGNPHETTIAEVVALICQLAGTGQQAAALDTAAAWGRDYEDIDRRVPLTTKASDLLGFQARITLAAGLSATIDWARSNPWWLETVRDEIAPARVPQGAS
jgi:nucleoside-diphosphate-sugar epimerase